MKTAHTPTPWALDQVTHRHVISVADPGKIWDNDPPVTAVCPNMSDEYDRKGQVDPAATANAEFIVRAVNSHDALVDALEWLLAFVEGPFVDAKAREAHLDFAPHRPALAGAALAAAKQACRAALAAARKEGAG